MGKLISKNVWKRRYLNIRPSNVILDILTLDKNKLYDENHTLFHLIQDLRLNHNILVAKLYCDFFLSGKAYLDSINDETKLKKYCLKFIARLNEFIQNNMIKLKSFKNYKQKHCDYDGVTPKRDLIEIITNLYGDIIFRKESELSRDYIQRLILY